MSSQALSTRTAIVTGASRGIGRAIAVALGQANFRVVINYNSNVQAAQECADLVRQTGSDARVVQADVGNLTDHPKLIQTAVDWSGRIDLLVNNAGIAPKVRADLLDLTAENYDQLLATNLRGPLFLTQAIAKRMIQDRAKYPATQPPIIVNISSISAYAVSVNRGEYCIAKAGVAMMTRLFAARLAEHGINVYEIRPGIIATDMTGAVKAKYDKLILEDSLLPIRRWGQPQDIASAVLALTQYALPYSTGQVLDIDGGFHLRSL